MHYVIEWTPTFKRGYKQLSEQYKARVREALDEMVDAKDPRALGIKKRGPLAELYAYEVGQQVRILYSVSDNVISLLRVGPHAEVYR